MGYALRRMVIYNRVIKNPHIVYDSIDVHVILASITMNKMRLDRTMQFELLEKV